MHDLNKTISKFQQIVSPNFCNELAMKVGLVQRSSSQLKGYEFAQSMMIPNAFLDFESLNSLAVRMRKINQNCDISASALAQRMNTKAAETFMKTCFEIVLNEIVEKELIRLPDLTNLNCFNRVLIEDSTMIELHEKLSPYFKGRGGMASKASLKINYIFDYLSEQVINIDFFSGNKTYYEIAKKSTSILERNDLVIRDLGYYSLVNIKSIENENAFYISRLKSNVDVYENKESTSPIDLAKYLSKNQWRGIIEMQVFITQEKHPVRLVACLMDEETINKRRREANRTAQRSGRQVGKKKLNLLNYSIFITNISSNMLSGESIMATYRARWRIELIFKQWKSCLKLNIFKGYRKERLHCLLYGRLIMILLLGTMSSILMREMCISGRELSNVKLINYLIMDHFLSNTIIEDEIEILKDHLKRDLYRRLCKDKRKRSSLRENVKNGKSYYNPNIKIA